MDFHGVWEAFLDAIAPPRGRNLRTRQRQVEDIPLLPTEHDLLGQRVTTLMDYRDTRVQDLIRALKYDRSRHAATLAARLIADFLREEIASLRLFSQKRVILVPVPLHRTRFRERGFNQIAFALESLSLPLRDGTVATLCPAALSRIRATVAQTRLARSERIKNLAGAFAVPEATLVANARVFLIDDVATTGATLLHAASPLKAAGAEVVPIALARA